MSKKMSTFRIREDVLLKLKRYSELSGLSQSQIIEMAIVNLGNHIAPADMEKKFHVIMMTLLL